MKFESTLRNLCFALAGITLIACGEMNHRHPGATKGALQSPPTAAAKDVPASRVGLFLVRGTFDPATPGTGKNIFTFRVVKAADLTPLSESSKVTAKYSDAGPDSQSDADILRQSDGRYVMTLDLKRKGHWEVMVHIAFDKIEDDYALQIDL